jgi:hypothetical protein
VLRLAGRDVDDDRGIKRFDDNATTAIFFPSIVMMSVPLGIHGSPVCWLGRPGDRSSGAEPADVE